MQNLEMIIHILYKRVPVQEVIEGNIRCDSFDEAEFLRMMSSYALHYSENEAANLLSYYTYIFRENARITGREASEKLNVFDALFYCAFQFLCIKNNEVLCHYDRLMEWRQVTLELGENLFVTAYLAAKVMPDEAMKHGFMWKRVIGHDNMQLNVMMGRGYSENHFHLNGSAPIFHISWVSLMNNLNTSRLVTVLGTYDKDRRSTNTAYKSGYHEMPFYTRALQAALIRLFLYSQLSGRHLKVGDYYINTGNITGYFDKKRIIRSERIVSTEAVNLAECALRWAPKYQTENVRLSEILTLLNDCQLAGNDNKSNLQEETKGLRSILESDFNCYTIPTNRLKDVFADIERDISFGDLFIKILNIIPRIRLEDARRFMSDMEIFYEIWDQITMQNVRNFLRNPEELIYQVNLLQSEIDSYRMNGNTLPGQQSSMDYALHEVDAVNWENGTDNFLFAGERWLMYMMFRLIYKRKKNYSEFYNLFYAYLLIKESIRSELVQSNKNVGFRNFQRYNWRKGDLLADEVYRNTFVKLAVSESIFTKSTKRLEVRICPAETVEKNRKMILRTDELLDPQNKMRNKFFYTLHFIKSTDRVKTDQGFCLCRHSEKRKQVERQTSAIVELREKYPLVGRRVLGIDAASNEIGCRAEVFAQAFRYLRGHRWSYITAEGTKNLSQLYSTYHVGEDFLDLADGLRAIDEAILFLCLGSGDRLGHALALGIDADEWYASKNYRIVLPKQDYLDNLVWVYHKLSEFNIHGFNNLKEWILGEFTVLFSEIYSASISKTEMECVKERINSAAQGGNYLFSQKNASIFNYYYAWMLRGDLPELYAEGFFNEEEFIRRNRDFLVNSYNSERYEYRRNPEISFLYYLYHYNQNVRKEGAGIQEFVVSKYYVKAVAEIQNALQKKIAKDGIAIETNPSSNFLIGTFRKYEKHPIIRFFNKGLVHDPEKLESCPQIPVSVNTDDQGVFNTSLENEYALLACAMESLTDEQDKPLYNKYDIYDWLDKIRNMGNEQSFGYIADMKDKDGYYDSIAVNFHDN